MVCQFLLYNKVNQLYIYICPHFSSLLRLPPILPIPPLQVVTKHRADLPVLCSCFPLANCFMFGSVYMSMPLSHFVTAYPSPSPYPQVHSLVGLCLYLRIREQVSFWTPCWIKTVLAHGSTGQPDVSVALHSALAVFPLSQNSQCCAVLVCLPFFLLPPVEREQLDGWAYASTSVPLLLGGILAQRRLQANSS